MGLFSSEFLISDPAVSLFGISPLKGTYAGRIVLAGTQVRVAMEVAVTVQSGPFVHALRILQRRGFSPAEEGTITKPLKRFKRRVANPRAKAWPHLRARFCLKMIDASRCEHGRAQDGRECRDIGMGHPCGIQRGLARRLYKALVLSTLLFGCEVWCL